MSVFSQLTGQRQRLWGLQSLTVNLEVLVLPVFNGYHVESGSVGEHQASGFLHARKPEETCAANNLP